MEFDLILTDVCLPDYFPGDSRPWFYLPIYAPMDITEIRDHLLSELSQGAIGGSTPWEVLESDLFNHLAKCAIDRFVADCIERNGKDHIYLAGTEIPEEDDDWAVTAYFVLEH